MIASVALTVGCGADGSAETPATQDTASASKPSDSAADAALPDGYVETPFGRSHASCVYEVPDGAEVDANGTVWLGDQKVRETRPCAYPNFRSGARVARAIPEDVASQTSALINGWVMSVEASANNTGVFPPRFNGIESSMTVPPTPIVAAFQVVFLFVSLTPADGKAILQPVIQWGGGNGAKWWGSAWHVGRDRNSFHSSFVNLTPGETLVGSIRDVRNTCVGTVCKWDVKLRRGNSAIASIRVDSSEAWSLAQKAVLEARPLSICRELPSGNALFLNTKVYEPYDPANVDARIDVTASLNWRNIFNAVSPSCNFNAITPNPTTAVLTYNWN
jgi:hypothetical protein